MGWVSTHPEKLVELVKEESCDFGLAFDGDGDRIIAVDENGDIVDGDKIAYYANQHLQSKGLLKDDMVVSTVMSNLGFYKALDAHGLKSDKTKSATAMSWKKCARARIFPGWRAIRSHHYDGLQYNR